MIKISGESVSGKTTELIKRISNTDIQNGMSYY